MRNEFKDLFSKIEKAGAGQPDAQILEDSPFDLLGLIAVAQQQGGYESELEKAELMLEKLAELSHGDELLRAYIDAAVSYITSDYNSYMKQIEGYISKYIARHGVIDHDTAHREYFLMFWGINADER